MAEWRDIATAPKDGTPLRVRYDWNNETENGVYFAETRQCMLGSRAGECGPGFVSEEAGYLPVEPTHWMPLTEPPEDNSNHDQE